MGVTNGDDITAAYSTAATNGSPAGTYAIVPSLVDPNDSQTNYTVTLVSATLTISQTATIITWTNPAPITYGAALSSNQLNATANVPGNFVYSPTNGAVLNTGSNTLSVIFTPLDTVDYTNAAATVSLVVQPAALTVTANNTIQAYGQATPALTGTIVGVTNGDNITAAYNTTATIDSPAGIYAIVPSLVDPNDRQTNYSVTLVDGTLTVSLEGMPIITWTNPVPMTYGTALSTNQLNAVANVPGSFVYSPTNGAVLNTGSNTLSVLFTPSDLVDYATAAATVSVVVQPAALTVTANNGTAVYGQPLPVLTGTIVGVTNGDDITAAYSTAATNGSPAGTYAIVPGLVDPNDSQTNYTVTLVSATLTISQTAMPMMTWTNPAPITYGTALSSNQLNATANVPGSFVYNPTNGTVLNTGTQHTFRALYAERHG